MKYDISADALAHVAQVEAAKRRQRRNEKHFEKLMRDIKLDRRARLGRTIGRHARRVRRSLSLPTNSDSQYLTILRATINEFRYCGKKPRGAAYDYARSRGIK